MRFVNQINSFDSLFMTLLSIQYIKICNKKHNICQKVTAFIPGSTHICVPVYQNMFWLNYVLYWTNSVYGKIRLRGPLLQTIVCIHTANKIKHCKEKITRLRRSCDSFLNCLSIFFYVYCSIHFILGL